MNKRLINNKGSSMVLVVIIITTITLLGFSLLNITLTQYKIRKSNSEIKMALYLSEDGLNYAYLKVYNLIKNVLADSIYKSEDFLLLYPDDYSGAVEMFYNNYKFQLINNVVSIVNSNINPSTEVLNSNKLVFKNNKLTINISSKYVSENGIEKVTAADIIVTIPDYYKVKANEIDLFELIEINNFNF